LTKHRTKGTGFTLSVNDKKDDGEERLWHIFTDGSKCEQGVGSGISVSTGKVLTEQLKFELDNRCSNNQAEQLAIVKALEVLETQQVNNNEHRKAVIYTDSKITLDSIRSTKNHNLLVEEIRRRAVTLEKRTGKYNLNG
jgi:ribonuclease HI